MRQKIEEQLNVSAFVVACVEKELGTFVWLVSSKWTCTRYGGLTLIWRSFKIRATNEGRDPKVCC